MMTYSKVSLPTRNWDSANKKAPEGAFFVCLRLLRQGQTVDVDQPLVELKLGIEVRLLRCATGLPPGGERWYSPVPGRCVS